MHRNYTLDLTVRDQPGVLVRVAHLFDRRGCNIRAMNVTPHDDAAWSTMSLTVRDVSNINLTVAQLNKLIDVYNVTYKEYS